MPGKDMGSQSYGEGPGWRDGLGDTAAFSYMAALVGILSSGSVSHYVKMSTNFEGDTLSDSAHNFTLSSSSSLDRSFSYFPVSAFHMMLRYWVEYSIL